MVIYGLLLVAVVLISYLLTYVLRRYALAQQLMDIPNARSSHTVPTPRGGGMAFVMVFLLSLPLLYALSIIPSTMLWALGGAGLLIAIVGFLDDKQHIPARWRLLAHFTAAIWLLYWFYGFPSITLFTLIIPSSITTLLAVFYLVWLLNLYNFMDGIDGIASVEAISVCVGGVICYLITGHDLFIISPLLLAASVLGFLIWNFPPAKIFMGDAGSGFLGIVLGGLSIQAAWLSIESFIAWLILLGVFIVDATWTLIHRVLRSQKIYEAHRSHAYQFATRIIGGHLPVTMAILVINLVWLLPIALLVVTHCINAWLGLLIAYLPLAGIAYYFKAGSAE